MKKRIISTFIILFILVSACGHYGYVYNFLACVFYGECSEYYTEGTTQTTQLVSLGQNNGASLQGEWQNKNGDNNYILNFIDKGKLSFALYQQDELERYDLGNYSVTNDVLTITMHNGTVSVVKYQIKNDILILTSYNPEMEKNKTAQ